MAYCYSCRAELDDFQGYMQSYCTTCYNRKILQEQMEENSLSQARIAAEQLDRQEELQRDRIRAEIQLEEYRQREKLLDLIPGYREQQAVELAEKIVQKRKEKQERERQYAIERAERDRYNASPEGRKELHDIFIKVAKDYANHHLTMAMTWGMGAAVLATIALVFFSTNHSFLAFIFGAGAVYPIIKTDEELKDYKMCKKDSESPMPE